jgi:hypothetical protein
MEEEEVVVVGLVMSCDCGCGCVAVGVAVPMFELNYAFSSANALQRTSHDVLCCLN